jgi:hypothetical protein
MATHDITLDQLLTDYDWAQVFADENAGNVDKTTREALPGSGVSTAPASRPDVARIVAAVNGENDGAEWLGLFELKDGRYLVAQGGCDYTGWDCQASNAMTVASTLDEALVYGLSDEEARRLGLESERLAAMARA